MRHSCKTLGHVVVDQDIECLVCGKWITKDDKIHWHKYRDLGELRGPGAMAYDFGPANTGQDQGAPSG